MGLEFTNKEQANLHANKHINIFNEIRYAAGACERRIKEKAIGHATPRNQNERDKVANTNPGHAFTFVVEFLKQYDEAIKKFNDAPIGAEKDQLGENLEAMLASFQKQVGKAASTFSLLRDEDTSGKLYEGLAKVFDIKINSKESDALLERIENVQLKAARVGRGVAHAFNPSTWMNKLNELSKDKKMMKDVKIPDRKSPISAKTWRQQGAEFINKGKEGIKAIGAAASSIIRPVFVQSSKNENAIQGSSDRPLSNMVKITRNEGELERTLGRVVSAREFTTGRDREPGKSDVDRPSIVLAGGNTHQLVIDIDNYQKRAAKKDKTADREVKAGIAAQIKLTLALLFPAEDQLKDCGDAMAELKRELEKLKSLEEMHPELLKESDLGDMIVELKELCQERIDDYAAEEDEQKLAAQAAMWAEAGVRQANVQEGAGPKLVRQLSESSLFSSLAQQAAAQNKTPKDMFVLSHAGICAGVQKAIATLPDTGEAIGLKTAMNEYFAAIVDLERMERTDELDQVWQKQVGIVNERYEVLKKAVEVFNEGSDRQITIDAPPQTPASIVHGQIAFMQNSNQVMVQMEQKMNASKTLAGDPGYNDINQKYEQYKEAVQNMIMAPDDHDKAQAVKDAYDTLDTAINNATKPRERIMRTAQQPPVEVSALCANLKIAMKVNGNPLGAPEQAPVPRLTSH